VLTGSMTQSGEDALTGWLSCIVNYRDCTTGRIAQALNAGYNEGRMRANIKISRGIAGRVTITFPYDPAHVAKVKAIEGTR